MKIRGKIINRVTSGRTEYITLWFVRYYHRFPSAGELRDLVDIFIMPKRDFPIPFDKLERWADYKRGFERFLKDEQRKKG